MYVTDGGLETDLIFHHGYDLPYFAAFPLLEREDGRAQLDAYYSGYADVARRAGVGLLLESPTWRANPDWGAQLGYDATDLGRVNRAAVEHLDAFRARLTDLDDVRVSGQLGPRGDGYVPGQTVTPDAAADYHAPQLQAFAAAGADTATALTLTDPGEAIGIVVAARAAGLAIAIGFTVETDGRLADGTTLAAAIERVDAAAAPDYYVLNCAHPAHVAAGAAGADSGAWRDRVQGLRPNASRRSHAELDASADLDEGDIADLVATADELAPAFGNLQILGGCCGTDVRHVAALWHV